MDGGDRTPVATLHSATPLVDGRPHTLGEDSAHHLSVVRASLGDRVALRDGTGGTALGTLVKLARRSAVVDVDAVQHVEQLEPVHLLAPIADRERMLWLAEKATELGLTSWRPVLWRRSKSVSPRGEGPMFQQKLRGRMLAALLQSQGAWLPETFPDATAERALAASPEGTRILLDIDGAPLLSLAIQAPVTLAVGPEGGLEPRERDVLLAGGFVSASLGPSRLRFETAAVASLAIIRAALLVRNPQSAVRYPQSNEGAHMQECLFCRIVAREIPANVVAESDDAVALRDVNPQAPVHVLVIPKKHVRDLDEAAADPPLLGRLLEFAARIAREEGIVERGYRVVINTNLDGGQSVYHLHIHLLGGRQMSWPPG